MNVRVTRSRELVARGYSPTLVARVARVSRQALYRTPGRPPKGVRRPMDDADRAIVQVAGEDEHATDGTRMIASARIGRPVNRKRAQRVMREHRLLQPVRAEGPRKRPGFFQVTRPDELWHLDMTSVGVAEHGWCYLNTAIDCCTREIARWALDTRCRTTEALAVIDRAIDERGVPRTGLTLGTDSGTAYTSKGFRKRLAALEITHRRGGYRDPESQAFIESWFGKLKLRLIWRTEFETLAQARTAIQRYIEHYHHRPHSGLNYKTPAQVAQTWHDHRDPTNTTTPN